MQVLSGTVRGTAGRGIRRSGPSRDDQVTPEIYTNQMRKFEGTPANPAGGAHDVPPDPLVGVSTLRLSNSRRLDYLDPPATKTQLRPWVSSV
jgi:hypothetical protein